MKEHAGMSGGNLALATKLRAQATACESVQDIINIAATAEALAVTALGGALDNAKNGKLALNDEQQDVVRAARAEEQAHYDFLVSAGAEPLVKEFTLPDEKIVTDVPTFLTTVTALEEAFIAAYMAAAQEFAVAGEQDLVQYALQIGAVEAEHRAHVRFYAFAAGLIDDTPNNVAFEEAKFVSVGAAAKALTDLGFIGGDGTKMTYPGPGEIDNTGIENLKP
jgi:hypothetical protein